MNNRRLIKIFSVLIAAIILGVIIIVNFYRNSNKPVQPIAQKGYLDLSSWNFEKDDVVKLDGEWEFYWNSILTADSFSSDSQKSVILKKEYMKVPSEWNSSKLNLCTANKGYATYRLIVKLDDEKTILALKTTSIRMSNRIFVDGIQVGSSGNPAISRGAGYIMANTPYICSFYPKSNELEIIVQVANFDFKVGGIVQSIYLGKNKDILMMLVRNNFLNGFVASCLFITGIYYLFVFIGRRKDFSLIYYSAYALAFSFFEILYDEKIFMQMFGNLDNQYINILKIQNVLLNLTIIYACFFINKITEKVIPKWFYYVVIVIFWGYCILFLALPFSVSFSLQNMNLVLGMMAYLFMILFLLFAVIKKKYGALGKTELIRLILAFTCVLVHFFDGMLYLNNMKNNNYVGYVAILLFIGILYSLLSRQYNKYFDTIEKMNIQLLELDKLKDEFLANTSHELRTPLNGMINLTQSVMDRASESLTQVQQDDLKIVVMAGRKLNNLINDILDMSCLKRGEIKLALNHIDARPIATVVINVMEHLRQDKAIEFVNSMPEERLFVVADEDRLRQIFFNLIGNALKFTESGKIEIGGRQTNNMVELWVKDTGCGIPNDKLDDIFQSFYQINSCDYKETQGTGLGLSITRQLIELHGGTISVSSVLGEGSKFVFTLPISKNTTAALHTQMRKNEIIPNTSTESFPTIAGKNAIGKYSILIADDDFISRRALMSILDFEGYFVKEVADGEQALLELERHPDYDLVILDIMMPKLHGIEVTKSIRKKFSNIDIPIIMLTAKNRQEDIRAAFNAGANDYIAKPFEAEELKARISTLVQIKKSVNSIVSSELSFLQAQIKPHFLYNALSVISSLIIREPKRAKELLVNLSDYLRGSFIFDNNEGLISISTELQTVVAYLAIEKARFKERLNIEYEIDEDITVSIPILSIQPLVENAVRHGVTKKVEGGTVRLAVKKVADSVLIEVCDDGLGIDRDKILELLQSDNKQGVGLINIHKRMLKIYGQGLHMESEIGKGTKITFVIPLS